MAEVDAETRLKDAASLASSSNNDINNTENTDEVKDVGKETEEVLVPEAGEDVKNNTTSLQKPYLQKDAVEKEKFEERSDGVETVGPAIEKTSTETEVPEATGISGDDKEEQTSSISSSQDSACDEHDQKETDPAQNDSAQNEHPEEEDHSEENEPQERRSSPTPRKGNEDQVDRQEVKLNKEPWGRAQSTNFGADVGKKMGEVLVPEAGDDVKNNTTSLQKPCSHIDAVEKEKIEERSDGVETVGPAIEQKTTEPKVAEAPGIYGGNGKIWITVIIVALISFLVHHFLHSDAPPEKKDVRQVDIFLRELKIVETQFPSQNPELWRRSRIHMARHLQMAHPTEPVSLILTAGRNAERTLLCLAQGLASAFSAALNSSVLQIDGASKAVQDSDQVKMDIDRQLRAAFEGDKHVAVVHRFEELPPASTLIFYRYCDHENAAYKKTSLIFTVLLGGEEELPAHLGLSAVEEMVDDQLKKKFLSSSHAIAFNSMDLDKYSGLWSRISHLILPVAADKRIEHKGC